MRKSQFFAFVAVLILTLLNVPHLWARAFVAEATRVIEGVRQESLSANKALENFYREFNRYASEMVDLEARVQRWKKEGYLCEKYQDCPEKWDGVFAQYGYYMREIERLFNEHRPKIQQAVQSFHRRVYEGLDHLRDLKISTPSITPETLRELRSRQIRLSRDREALEQQCPPGQLSRECLRRWRAFNRRARQLNREIQRAIFTSKLARLKRSISERLEAILTGLTDIEDKATNALAHYAMLFSEYEELSGSSGIGALINAIEEIKVLDQKLKELEQFSKGLEIHVLELGKLLDKRLAMTEERLGIGEGLISSSQEEVSRYTELLEQNDRLLEELSRELQIR